MHKTTRQDIIIAPPPSHPKLATMAHSEELFIAIGLAKYMQTHKVRLGLLRAL